MEVSLKICFLSGAGVLVPLRGYRRKHTLLWQDNTSLHRDLYPETCITLSMVSMGKVIAEVRKNKEGESHNIEIKFSSSHHQTLVLHEVWLVYSHKHSCPSLFSIV